jgi:hypothetical protein
VFPTEGKIVAAMLPEEIAALATIVLPEDPPLAVEI